MSCNGVIDILGFKLYNMDILLIFIIFIALSHILYKIKPIRIVLDKITNFFIGDDDEWER